MPLEMEVHVLKDGSFIGTDESVNGEEELAFYLKYTEIKYIAKTTLDIGFQNSAHALSCDPPGYGGLKSPLSTIKISSNQPFQGIQAGEAINEHFHVVRYASEPDEDGNPITEELTLEEGISIIESNLHPEYGLGGTEINFSSLPGNNLEHTFTVELNFECSSSIAAITVPVQF